ncbi:MAG: hypothetical protein ACREN5_03260 [Gemmatimonadales bacterium]
MLPAVLLVHDDRLNLSYFVASVLTALTPVIILAAIGWFVFRAYRKGARSGGEGGSGKGEGEGGAGGERPDEWRYRG